MQVSVAGLNPAVVQFGPTSVLGWRVRQAADQGVAVLLHELGARCLHALHTDVTAMRTVQAAVALGRADLAAGPLSTMLPFLTDSAQLRLWAASAPPLQLGTLMSLLLCAHSDLEGPLSDALPAAIETLAGSASRRIAAARQRYRSAFNLDDASTEAALSERSLVECIDLVPSLLDAAESPSARGGAATRWRSAARSVVDAIAGNDWDLLGQIGGDAQRCVVLLESAARVAQRSARSSHRSAVLRCFHELTSSRLFVTGAVAQQPDGDAHEIVRPFGASHLHGVARTCTTEAWLRALIAVRSLLAASDEQHRADEWIELVLYNAVLVSVGTDPGRWFGPVPHGLDRTEEINMFGEVQDHHRFAPGPWRASMRSPGTHDQCCAASSLLALAGATRCAVFVTEREGSTLVEIAQLAPAELAHDRFLVNVSGGFPFVGDVGINLQLHEFQGDPAHHVEVRVRTPAWATSGSAWTHLDHHETHHAFDVPVHPRLVMPHPLLTDIRGCVAVMAGPFVYCLEGADQMGHLQPRQVRFDPDGALMIRCEVDHPESPPTIHATGDWNLRSAWSEAPEDHPLPAYVPWSPQGLGLPVDLAFLPFYAIANRGYWDVAIWMPLATPTDRRN